MLFDNQMRRRSCLPAFLEHPHRAAIARSYVAIVHIGFLVAQVPAALAAAEPEERLQSALEVLNLKGQFDVVVSAEDVSRGRPDPEAYLHAAQKLGRPPVRCVVIGNSNQVRYRASAVQFCRQQCMA